LATRIIFGISKPGTLLIAHPRLRWPFFASNGSAYIMRSRRMTISIREGSWALAAINSFAVAWEGAVYSLLVVLNL